MLTTDLYGLSGQVLDGQFRIDRVIGEGSFSVVYRAQHLGLDEPVAVKCLKLQAQLGSEVVEAFIRRFRDESKIHYRLSRGSLHIVRTIAAGTTMAPATGALVPYMVLEWLEGFTLAEGLRARRERGEGGRSIAEVLRLLEPVAEAMAYAHAQGVVHRDLTPSNIFIAHAPDGSAKLKVLDFGVAKVISDHALALGPRAVTLGQVRMFTPAYAAPEQFQEALGPIGTHTDVYAFALILVELLADRTPVDGDHLGHFADRALDRTMRPTPRAMGIAVTDSVEAVIARAVAVEPSERPRDIGAFWEMMKQAAAEDTRPAEASESEGHPREATEQAAADRGAPIADREAALRALMGTRRATLFQGTMGSALQQAAMPPPSTTGARPTDAVAPVPAAIPPQSEARAGAHGPAEAVRTSSWAAQPVEQRPDALHEPVVVRPPSETNGSARFDRTWSSTDGFAKSLPLRDHAGAAATVPQQTPRKAPGAIFSGPTMGVASAAAVSTAPVLEVDARGTVADQGSTSRAPARPHAPSSVNFWIGLAMALTVALVVVALIATQLYR